MRGTGTTASCVVLEGKCQDSPVVWSRGSPGWLCAVEWADFFFFGATVL